MSAQNQIIDASGWGEKITILSLTDCWEPEGTLSAILVKKKMERRRFSQQVRLDREANEADIREFALPNGPYITSSTYVRFGSQGWERNY